MSPRVRKEAALRSLPFDEWPKIDRQDWVRATRASDPFDAGGRAARWSEATIDKVSWGYGSWLLWLKRQGCLDFTQSPAERIRRDQVRGFVAELANSVSPLSVCSAVADLGHAAKAIAPDLDWGWISRGACRLKSTATPVRDKLTRLQSPDRLLDLGIRLMAEAEEFALTNPSKGAETYRDGLMIAFLACRPIRRRNLMMMRCGTHIMQSGTDWSVHFSESETKNRRPISFPFPTEVVMQLERYLAVYRPSLMARSGRQKDISHALWLNHRGDEFSSDGATVMVNKRTKKAFGKAINPHLFRDCAATAIAIVDPQHVGIVMAILGHSSLRTAEDHYNQARGLEASRRHQRAVKLLRSGSNDDAEKRILGSSRRPVRCAR